VSFSTRIHRRSTWALCAVTLLVAVLTVGATTSTPSAAANKDLGHGVTADSIKIGFAVVDYDAIKDFVDYNHGDQKKVINTFVDYINKNGGIDGRKIVPDIKEYPPIPGGKPDPLSLCTSWAEDDDVFAVLGVFIDFTGQGQLCLTKEHDVVHIGHELDQPWIDAAKGGLLLTPDQTKEQAASVVVNLLAQSGKLKGKTVAVVGDKNSESRVNDVVVPALKKAKVKTGSTAILTITGTDTTAAQSQLDSFIEKWKSENVNTVFLAGNDVSAKQFVETIKAAMPKVQLVTDTDTTLDQAQDEQKAGKTPNPYDGILSATGLTQTERWANKNPLLQQCVDIYQKATGETVPGPDQEQVVDGKKVQLDVAVTDMCGELFMFRDIAKRVGPDLTPKNWQKTVDKFGPIQLVPNQISSLCKGKYAANDGFRLVAYDPKLGDTGDWKKVTAIKDASDGKCAKAAAAGT
jgi:ABC-type branched-subunit amino acid transport system substrate-binding protein